LKEDFNLEEFGTKVANKEGKKLAMIDSPSDVQLEKVDERAAVDYTQWSVVRKGEYTFCGKTIEILPSGFYNIRFRNGLTFFEKRDINLDEIINFSDSISNAVVEEIEGFWNKEIKFEQNGFLHRRGYLFFGPQGSGKSILCNQIVQNLIKRGGVAFYCDITPASLSDALVQFRKVEPKRKICCIFEDIDAIISRYGESSILSFLDGEDNLQHLVNLATTNYPELLDRRIVARPRRFDRRIRIDMPSAIVRKEYFERKLEGFSKDKIDTYVKLTKGFSFAALSDFIISTQCLENSVEDTITILTNLLTKKVSSDDFEKRPGFNNNEDED